MFMQTPSYTIFRLPQVMKETGYARSTIWYQIKRAMQRKFKRDIVSYFYEGHSLFMLLN